MDPPITKPHSTMMLVVFVLLASQVDSYPVFGTKRYQRNSGQQMPFVAPSPVQIYSPQPQYGNLNPYGYVDDSNYIYYSRQDPRYHDFGLPMYHGDYKATPYYYAQGPSYQYFDDRQNVNPLDNLHEEMMHEDEKERQRQLNLQNTQYMDNEDYYPDARHQSGHPQFDYNDEQDDESDHNDQSALLNTNAAFLNNLIMYNKQLTNDKKYRTPVDSYLGNASPQQDDYFDQGDYYDHPQSDEPFQSHTRDDKAVKELKELTNVHAKPSRKADPVFPDSDYWGTVAGDSHVRDSEFNNQYEYDDDSWINWDSKRSVSEPKAMPSIVNFSDRKPGNLVISKVPQNHFVLNAKEEEAKFHASTTTEKPHDSTGSLDVKGGVYSGQKEVVLLRPATPVRHPFSAPVIKMLENQENFKQNKYDKHVNVEDLENKKRISDEKTKKANKDTVYDTIKHLISMENRIQNNAVVQEKPRLAKRFVTNEESLVQQLDSLKRMSV